MDNTHAKPALLKKLHLKREVIRTGLRAGIVLPEQSAPVDETMGHGASGRNAGGGPKVIVGDSEPSSGA